VPGARKLMMKPFKINLKMQNVSSDKVTGVEVQFN
jgi:hypothetical protein